MKQFYEFRNITEKSFDIYFYGDIVSSSWQKWSDEDKCPDDIVNQLKSNEGKELTIYINSGGGSVFGGMAIYNLIKRFNGKKTAYIDGLAASISSVIPLACDVVYIPKNAYYMIHKPWSGGYGNATEMRKLADTLDRIEEGILAVYAENLCEGITLESIKQLVEEEKWFVGEEVTTYFNKFVVTDAIEAQASTSKYFNEYAKVPKELIKKEPEKVEDAIHEELEILASFLYVQNKGGL